MTINDPNAYAASQWDWACLDGCFGQTKIKPTDIDGWVERKARHLILETKLPGVEMPDGQLRTFKALAETGLFTILLIWGKPGKPTHIHLITRHGDKEFDEASIYTLRDLAKQWYEFADHTPLPKGVGSGIIAMGSFIMKHFTAKEREQLVNLLREC